MIKPAWAPTAERMNDSVNRLVAAVRPLKVILCGGAEPTPRCRGYV
jgi:hypothetical protein